MTVNSLNDRVPLADPLGDLAPIRQEILTAFAEVLDSGVYILGPKVISFEKEIAARLGVAEAVGVASGTDALVLALLAVGVHAGDEVITVSHTAGPTVAAIRMIGAIPVLVDIESETYCLDPAKLDAAYSARTKAVIAVHLYGHPADIAEISLFGKKRGVAIIEDCAQAQDATVDGRQVGSFGDTGCFSFYPTKNLGAIGDGGLVSTREPATGERLRHLRTYGWTRPQFATIADGRCSRLDPLQAAVLSVKLRYLGDQIERRRGIASRYNEAFADLPLTLPKERAGCRHVYHLYVVRSDRRDDLSAHLDRNGVGTGLHYPYAVHTQPALVQAARIPESLPVTESIATQILTLPLFPSLSESQQDRVIAAVRSFFAGR